MIVVWPIIRQQLIGFACISAIVYQQNCSTYTNYWREWDAVPPQRSSVSETGRYKRYYHYWYYYYYYVCQIVYWDRFQCQRQQQTPGQTTVWSEWSIIKCCRQSTHTRAHRTGVTYIYIVLVLLVVLLVVVVVVVQFSVWWIDGYLRSATAHVSVSMWLLVGRRVTIAQVSRFFSFYCYC